MKAIMKKNGVDRIPSPTRVFVTVLTIVFVAEAAVMFLLTLLPHVGDLNEAIMDASILTFLVAPFLWMFIIRPLGSTALSEKVRAENIVAHAADGIMTINEQGEIESFNLAAEQVFGYKVSEAIGKAIEFLLPPPHKTLHDTYREHLSNIDVKVDGDFTTEIMGLRKDGSTFPMEITVNEMLLGNRRLYLGILRDITERKRLETNLREAKVEAESSNQAKSEFLANMSHEIRTPMNAIIGMTELALDTELTQEQTGYLNMVQSASESLLTLINDILDLSKIEAGQLELEEISVDLRKVVENVAEILSIRAHDKGLELLTYIEPDLPTFVISDPTRLNQILTNLVNNAIKFTQKGEIILKVLPLTHPKKRADVGDRIDLRFEVIDTGIGVSPNNQSKIFRKFSQADSSTTRKFGGTGLGLSITKSLIELMGGQLRLESKLGTGSKFYFSLQMPVEDKCAKKGKFSYPNFEEVSVLVIDDNSTNRFILRRTLSSWGFQVTEASGGKEALALLKKATEEFGLIITDYQMPELDGVSVVQSLREDLKLADMKVIMLTSWGELNSSTQRELGLAACICKPVKQSRLFDLLMGVLKVERIEEGLPESVRPTLLSDDKGSRRILLVEDNVDNQNLAKTILKKAGYTVDVVDNGKLAMEIAAKVPYDLILMDVQMPVLDGFEATAKIREYEQRTGDERVPIIALTAHALQGYREKCLANDMDDYLTKPLKRIQLLERISQWLAPQPVKVISDESSVNHSLD